MTKINLVIASILKPIDDTRMYEKIGITLANSQKYCVNIIGFKSINKPSYKNINFFPLFDFSRSSYQRILAPLKYYKILLKVKPKVVIVESPELLIVTSIYKILYGCKLYYDVLENYYYNILYISKERWPLKMLIGFAIRIMEWIASPFVSEFILAEKSYQEELPFIGKKFAVLENKFAAHCYFLDKPKTDFRSRFHLLYTGTIAKSFGVYAAIELVKKLHMLDSRYHLTIIGFCADANEYAKINTIVSQLTFVRVMGGNFPVPHSHIVEMIRKADIGLICYEPNVAIANKMPTKLFEYIYHKLPIILAYNTQWGNFCKPFKAAIMIDYSTIDPQDLHSILNIFPFYSDIDSVNFSQLIWEKSVLLRIIN